MKKFNLIILILFLFVGKLHAQDTLLLNFDQAVEYALKANLDFQIQNNNQEVLKHERRAALFAQLPTTNINSNFFRQNGQQFQQVEGEIVVTNVTNDIISGGLSMNMPLFNSGRRMLETQAAKLSLTAGENGLKRARQQVVFDVAQRYLQVLLDQELVRIASENLENQQQQLRQIEGFVDAGIRTISDRYNQQSEVARLESVLVDARITLENDLWSLTEYLQLETGTVPELESVEFSDSDGFVFAEENLSDLVSIAMENRVDRNQQELLVTAAKKSIQASKAMYFPRVNAFFNYNTFFTSLDERSTSEQLWRIYPQNTIGFNLAIPIFNNWQNRLAVVRARVNFQNETLREEALDRRIFQDVKLAHQNYQAALQKFKNAAVQVNAAEEAYLAVNERFRLGLSTFVDLATANQQRVAAKSDQAQAVYSLYFQETLMRFALGITE
ncbi:TolC family protein [Algoriphagus hitonicola]|uniref:Outer membrane protein n=1 Tax=Algoriphagus hitonicola TaxID=435880 RepID=A0A1I2T7Y4_9BACT|nr:TolC family protein [Algoriphagus hitonicola]SFG58391.1 outer membrane protein [Algoriphagus hitonicola]